jgi:hypothetical protein
MMKNKQFGEKHEPRSDNRAQQKGNLGQKDARQEREKEFELAHMGEKSQQTGQKDKRGSGEG